jgi:diphthamide synthase (EF-2-diphthine--ammonia ligase)
LVTSFDEASGQIPIHNVAMTSIRAHAGALGIPLRTVPLPWPCGNQEYRRRWRLLWDAAVREGIDSIVFGDIHLADIRAFREESLQGIGLTPVFPLWGCNPQQLAQEIIAAGIAATVTAVDEKVLSQSFVGRLFDAAFLADLPEHVDPCGENGEFHTVVHL